MKQIFSLIATGVVVGLHWITFFYSIKVSTVSIAVVCLSASTLFTSFLEPIVFKRPYLWSEFVLSIAVLAGIVAIFGFEASYAWGIVLGLFSALFSSLFNTMNGSFVKRMPSQTIAKYEMFGGFITAFIFLMVANETSSFTNGVSFNDWVYLIILAIVCTTFAFMTGIWVMKFLTPFSVSLSTNMEPIYTIIIALLLDWFRGTTKEIMSVEFYIGAAIILVAIGVHAYFKTKKVKLE